MRKYALLLPAILLFIPSCIVTIDNECDISTDCAANEVCLLGECTEIIADSCINHNQCFGTDVCVVDRCDTVFCETDNDCPVDDLVCNALGMCEPGVVVGPNCTVNEDCVDPRQDCLDEQCTTVRQCTENTHCRNGQVCDLEGTEDFPATFECVQCDTAEDCGQGSICNSSTNRCEVAPECFRNVDCQDFGGPNENLRMQCGQNQDGIYVCFENLTIECGNNSHCLGNDNGEICSEGLECVECETNDQCGEGSVCNDNQCFVAGDCANPLPVNVGDTIEGSRAGFENIVTGSCVLGSGNEYVMEFTAPEGGGPVCLSTKGSPHETIVVTKIACDGNPANEIACQDDVKTDPNNADRTLNFVHQTLNTAAGQTYFIFVDGFPVEIQPGEDFKFSIRAGECETACFGPADCIADPNTGCVEPEDCGLDAPPPECQQRVNLCGECFENNDCPGTNQCLDGGCFDLCDDASQCGVLGDGEEGCVNGVCSLCMEDTHCEDDQTCNVQTGVCENGDIAAEGTCENPEPIALGVDVPGDTVGAANNQDHVLDGSNNGTGTNAACVIPLGAPGNDYVYRFTPEVDGNYCIVVRSEDFDAVAYMTEDTCEVTVDSALFCYDEVFSPEPELIQVDLAADINYNLFVDGFAEGEQGDFTVNISEGDCPECLVNAHCEDGEVCDNKNCVQAECTVDTVVADCGAGFSCVNSLCVPPTTEDIQALFDNSCIGCHGGNRAPDVRDISSQINQTSGAGLVWIQPGDAEASYIYSKIAGTQGNFPGGGGGQMPQGGPFWDQDQIDQLAAWINSLPVP